MAFSYLRKTLHALKIAALNPWLLNLILESDERWKKHVQRTHPQQTELPRVDFYEWLDKSPEVVSPYSMLDGGSLPTDYLLLKKLAQRFTNCRYFEIGTWRGESVANVASVASECYTLDLTEDQLRAKGYNDDYINIMGMYSMNLQNVTHLKGGSGSFLFEQLNKKFDLIFIDGNHRYGSVKLDTVNVFKHLVHEESIVVWHDYGHSPERVRYEVFAGILDGLPVEDYPHLYHFSNTLCAVYTKEPLDTIPIVRPSKPNHYFSLALKLKNR